MKEKLTEYKSGINTIVIQNGFKNVSQGLFQ
jgi:hypothetical protein